MKTTTLKKYVEERTKDKKIIVILGGYLLCCLVSAIYWCIFFQPRNILMSIVFMGFVPLFFIVEHLINFRCGELFTLGVLGLAFGAILGTCFNLYTIIPFFDTILHGLSGILFSCLGFTLAEKFFGKATDIKKFFGCLIFAVCFSLAIAVIWEIFEYGCSVFLGLDMMEDSYVTNINSYLLSGSHSKTVEIDGIIKTIIYYGDGQTYIINGYLDLGLIDTLTDMIICTIGSIVFMTISIISFFKMPKVNEMLIPQVFESKNYISN